MILKSTLDHEQGWVTYPIIPVPKPRQTQSDKWKKRPCVLRYRAFQDDCRLHNVGVSETPIVIFKIPMPKSWSKKKRLAMLGKPHQQTPDIDNLLKALLDAVFKDDSHVYKVKAAKYWCETGSIQIWQD